MIKPILLDLGILQIRWYGLLLVLGIILAIIIFIKLAKQKGMQEKDYWDYIFWMIIGTFIGARLVHAIFYNPFYFFENPLRLLFIWEGGLASHGGILGGFITSYIFCKKRNLNLYELLDITVIPAILVGVFIRIGNFINQELVGRVTNVPWAVKFDNYEGLRHPSQIYSAIKNFIIFSILWLVKDYNKPKGFIFWLFITLYSGFRFAVEFYKDFPLYYSLTTGQILSIPFFIVGIIMLFKANKKS